MEGKGLHRAGIALGAGIMGTLDGIVFHQVLQWHHVVMEGSLSFQIVTDGLFHAFTLVVIIAGVWLLWKGCSVRHLFTDRQMQARLLMGAGAFTLIEGIIDHHLLQIHHVRPGPDQLSWDLVYLALGAILLAQGLRMKLSET